MDYEIVSLDFTIRLCSHFEDRFSSEILLLSNYLSTEHAEYSEMNGSHVIETEQFE